MRTTEQLIKYIKSNLGFDVTICKRGREKLTVRFNSSLQRIYVNFTNPFAETFLNPGTTFEFALLGNESSIWYWADINTWKKYVKKINRTGQQQILVKDKLEKENMIACLHDPDRPNENEKKAFIRRIKEDLHIGKLEDKLKELILDADVRQIICHGAPGTGKTYTITESLGAILGDAYGEIGQKEERKNFVQFHPSYDYTDFIEGLRPATVNEAVTYVRIDGIFKNFCRIVACKNKEDERQNLKKKYFFIIDEINRADLSKVFGELMYCLEDGNRGKNHKVQTQYGNIPCYEINNKEKTAVPISDDIFKDGFYIPENVIIIGTMNDIDRSVDSFDFAMQRRFCWINVDADIEMTENVLINIWKNSLIDEAEQLEDCILDKLASKIKEHASSLNRAIEDLLGVDYKIGQAYYKKAATFYSKVTLSQRIKEEFDKEVFQAVLNKIWNYSLRQLISSYFRGKRNGSENYRKCKDAFITGLYQIED